MKMGDKNTQFFHASVINRRKNNRIEQLENKNGRNCRNKEEVVEKYQNTTLDYSQQQIPLV